MPRQKARVRAQILVRRQPRAAFRVDQFGHSLDIVDLARQQDVARVAQRVRTSIEHPGRCGAGYAGRHGGPAGISALAIFSIMAK